jgi:hypothetical protein
MHPCHAWGGDRTGAKPPFLYRSTIRLCQSNRHEIHKGTRYLATECICVPKLALVDERECFYEFSLGIESPGDLYFKGTSGAPICDADGNLVALVCGPGSIPDSLRAIKLEFFKTGLDIEIAASKGAADESRQSPAT